MPIAGAHLPLHVLQRVRSDFMSREERNRQRKKRRKSYKTLDGWKEREREIERVL